jgi:glutathione S-transferase
MSKQILFCADGTWNGPPDHPSTTDIDGTSQVDATVSDDTTNVVKLFNNLQGEITPETKALANESEKALTDANGKLVQIAKYMHGVGDSKNQVLRVLGGVFGAGVIARIVRGYTFISRNYQPGDSIHLIGFSRGAYTARALGGMIAAVGLLNSQTYDVNDKNEAYLRGLAAWFKCKGVVFAGDGKLMSLLNAVLDFAGDAISRIKLGKNDLIADVPIASVAVWDTVGSMGIPLYVKGRRDFFTFVSEDLSPKVKNGFHAMALDERRRDFPVTRWTPRAGVEEVWFVGAHSDVGGGYPEAGLSDIALDWMMQKLAPLGVSFRTLDPPINVKRFEQDFHMPWSKPPFNFEPEARKFVAGNAVHPSVQERWTALQRYKQLWPKGFGQ